jgi:hypothetical protein
MPHHPIACIEDEDDDEDERWWLALVEGVRALTLSPV